MMHDKIQNLIPDAMRAKDTVRLTTLRGVLSGFTNEAMNLGKKPQDKLADEEALVVIKRLVKQRKDSIEQFKKGGRQDLVENEEAELKILEEFLPTQMSEEEIRKIVKLKIEDLKSNSDASVGAIKPNVGLIVGAVMKEAGGNADGALVKKIVEEILTN
jgi:uncharacterized protein